MGLERQNFSLSFWLKNLLEKRILMGNVYRLLAISAKSIDVVFSSHNYSSQFLQSRPELRQNHASRGRENVDAHVDWQTKNKLVEF